MARSYNPLSGFIEDRGLKWVSATRDPTVADHQLAPTIWVNTSTSNVFMQISNDLSAPVWVILTNGGGTMTDLAADVGTATPVLGVITIAGGTGTNTSAAGATLTVNLDVPVVVANGGTGAVTLTGLVVGNGTSAMTATTTTTYNVLVGAAGNTVANIAPSATTGIALVSNGNGANPSFSTVVVAGGGTGATTLTDHGILLGSGTDAITATAAPTNGQLLIGSTGNDPVLATLTEGEAIDITNAAGSITIACESWSETNKGVGELATDVEALAGTATDVVIVPTSLKAKLGTQTSHGIAIGAGDTAAITWTAEPSNGQLPIGSTGNAPVLATLTEGTGIDITNAAGSITIAVTGGGFGWTRVAGNAQNLAVQNGYTPTNVGLTTFTLPATAAIGDVIKIDGEGTGLFTVATQAGQTIYFGVLTSTTGVGGFITATHRRDCLTLRCINTNSDWIVENAIGNFGVT